MSELVRGGERESREDVRELGRVPPCSVLADCVRIAPIILFSSGRHGRAVATRARASSESAGCEERATEEEYTGESKALHENRDFSIDVKSY